jgi:hypothetical protein
MTVVLMCLFLFCNTRRCVKLRLDNVFDYDGLPLFVFVLVVMPG